MSSRSGLVSPRNERVRKLTERLQGIQCSFDTDKVGRVDILEKKLAALEEQVAEHQQFTMVKLNDLREGVMHVQKRLEEDRLAKTEDIDARLRVLESLENRVQSTIDQDLSLRRDAEFRILKASDDRAAAFRAELLKETKGKNDSCDSLRASLSTGLTKITEALRAAKSDFSLLAEDVSAQLDDTSSSVNSELNGEQKAREDTEEAMLAMLKDVVGRIKSDLETERKTREATEESLLGLLEDACAKLKKLTEC